MTRIEELSSLILRYQKSYYTNEAEISDAEFDALWDELKTLDPENPILHKVGSDLESSYPESYSSGNFEKATHIMPMGSQEKAANPIAFTEWANKMTYKEYLVEYKLDGASLELQYENGVFVKAVTRGDGKIGDDITKNASKMKGVIKTLKQKANPNELFQDDTVIPFSGGIRGEVIMSHDVHKNHFSDKANCRNAANGLMKRKDGNGSEYLEIICYDAWVKEDSQAKTFFSDEEDKVKWLSSIGFTTVPLKICHSIQEVIDYRVNVMEIRKTLDYDIDGLVIKGRKIDIADAKRARPEKQIAFKFSLEEAISVVRSVIWSESGATYTPIAEFDTVELAGTKVSRASLANPNTIKALGLKIGSHVIVVKRGEIIPKIESVVTLTEAQKKESQFQEEKISEIEIPHTCSTCKSELLNEGTRLYCPNKNCAKRIHHQLEKWVSVLDIRDFGITLIERLFNTKRLQSISDIYTLTEDDLQEYFLTQESISKDKESLSAKKVIASINSKRNIPLQTFIAGFDIEGIGETLVEKLIAQGYNTIDKLLNAYEEEIAQVNGFAEITSHTLCSGLKENKDEIEYLLNNKIIQIKESISDGKLNGMSFCFTGELNTMKRTDAQNLVKQNGGIIKTSVVKGLTYLVTNDTSSGSSKNQKAQELGTSIINEEAFLTLVK